MPAWSRFVREVYAELPDCPEPTVERALRNAAEQLLRTARSWRYPGLSAGPLALGESTYLVEGLPPGAILIGVADAMLAGEHLRESMGGEHQDGDDGCGTPTIHAVSPNMLALHPGPSAAVAGQSITLAGLLAPDGGADFPDFLWDTHHEAIERLAVAQLRRSVGKPWSDPQAAERAARDYERLALAVGSLYGAPRTGRLRVRAAP